MARFVTRYILKYRGSYLNTFKTFSAAAEERDRLIRLGTMRAEGFTIESADVYV